jgi:hypothetical protein
MSWGENRSGKCDECDECEKCENECEKCENECEKCDECENVGNVMNVRIEGLFRLVFRTLEQLPSVHRY